MARPAGDVIDQAIRENRWWEILASAYAVVFVLTRLSLIFWSVYQNEPVMTVAGVAESCLFWPAMKIVTRTRDRNLMLRMLEVH